MNLFVNFIIISMIEWEVKRDRDRNRLDRIEDRIGKLASDFNDIIRKKVEC